MRSHPFEHVGIEDVPVVLVADGRADTRLAAHEAFGFQDFQGFANDGAADAVDFAEVVFARQRQACRITVATDILRDRGRDVSAHARAALGARVFALTLLLDGAH